MHEGFVDISRNAKMKLPVTFVGSGLEAQVCLDKYTRVCGYSNNEVMFFYSDGLVACYRK